MSKSSTGTKNIAVYADVAEGYGRRVIQGLQHGASLNGDVALHLFSDPEQVRQAHAKGWLHGGIVTVSGLSAAALADCPLPIIGVCGRNRRVSWPIVDVAHAQIGLRAADALLACGLSSMVCLSRKASSWSISRIDGFRDRLRARAPGMPCAIWDEEVRLDRSLIDLEGPTGIFALNDRFGIEVVNACRSLDLPVPGRVAVIGADNDEILCGMCEPNLSSVLIPFEEIGLTAIRLISDLLAGRPVPGETHIRSIGIAERQSTDLKLVEDALSKRAISVCEDLGAAGIGPQALARRLDVSLRTLERSLHTHLHTTPAGLLRQVRLRQAYRMIQTTRKPIGQVAKACGFSSFSHFSSLFHGVYGVTPSHLRRMRR